MSPFEREYLGRPVEDTALQELAAKYHEETEAFDRSVCTGPIIRECVMPSNGTQHSLINRNAALVRERLTVEALKLGYSRSDLLKEIQRKNA